MTDQPTPEGPQEAADARESASTHESEAQDVQSATDAADGRTAAPSPDERRRRYAAAIVRVLDAVHIADDEDITDWQRGYRARSERVRDAIADAILAVRDEELQQLRDELAALKEVSRGYCPECGRGDCAPTTSQWLEQQRRAVKAEAALERVRALHTPDDLGECRDCNASFDPCPTIAALAEPKDPRS